MDLFVWGSCALVGVSHHILARKHFAGFLISPAAGELGIDHSIADVRMSDPVLHKSEVYAGIEEVGDAG
jgi:hypothetical protein